MGEVGRGEGGTQQPTHQQPRTETKTRELECWSIELKTCEKT